MLFHAGNLDVTTGVDPEMEEGSAQSGGCCTRSVLLAFACSIQHSRSWGHAPSKILSFSGHQNNYNHTKIYMIFLTKENIHVKREKFSLSSYHEALSLHPGNTALNIGTTVLLSFENSVELDDQNSLHGCCCSCPLVWNNCIVQNVRTLPMGLKKCVQPAYQHEIFTKVTALIAYIIY